MGPRFPLPRHRRSVTREADLDGMRIVLTVGFYDDGSPGEIFVTASKQGSTVQGLCDTIARLASIALQAGVDVDDVADAMRGLSYPPSGMTGDRELVREASSLSDWIGQHLILAAPKDFSESGLTSPVDLL